MSEFAKQPHPDASHRERLSREIPGLSSRQVQVWFQNRYDMHTTPSPAGHFAQQTQQHDTTNTAVPLCSRAKIKRLSVNEREQVIKMRAVPDGFDNVQALHAPYGAVHTVGSASVSAAPSAVVDFCAAPQPSAAAASSATSSSPYPDQQQQQHHHHHAHTHTHHLMRPLLGPGSSSSIFSAQPSPASLGTPELLSPLSASSAPSATAAAVDRFASYGAHLSPTSAGPSPSMPSRSTFARGYPYPHHHHHGMDAVSLHRPAASTAVRPLQPLQLSRRSHSESLPSPLRITTMSWKGPALDYYPAVNARSGMYEAVSGAGYESGSSYNSECRWDLCASVREC
jgi:hypothetical protein